MTVPSGGSFSKTGSGTLSVTNSGTFGPSADLILDVDARLDGGSICVGRTGDGHPDLPSLQINQDFTIGAGADSTTFNCSANVVRVNGPSGHLFKEGAGTIMNHGRFDVAGGMLSIGAGQTFEVVNGISQSGGLTSIAAGGVLQGVRHPHRRYAPRLRPGDRTCHEHLWHGRARQFARHADGDRQLHAGRERHATDRDHTAPRRARSSTGSRWAAR